MECALTWVVYLFLDKESMADGSARATDLIMILLDEFERVLLLSISVSLIAKHFLFLVPFPPFFWCSCAHFLTFILLLQRFHPTSSLKEKIKSSWVIKTRISSSFQQQKEKRFFFFFCSSNWKKKKRERERATLVHSRKSKKKRNQKNPQFKNWRQVLF